MKGKLIVFEGLDRSGKSTQSKRLAKSMQCQCIAFPCRECESGKLIDKIITKQIQVTSRQYVHLLFSANRYELKPKIQRLLSQGKNVILDRYRMSGSAYSIAQGLDHDWCIEADRMLPAPDLTIFMESEPELNALRKDFGVDKYQVLQLQKKIAQAYKGLIAESQDPVISIKIDRLSIEEVQKLIRKELKANGILASQTDV